jgi:glycosyltransferase involved in cell wall biosynthesis
VLSAEHADSVPYLRRAGRRHPGKLIQMPNGVDTETFAPGPDELRLRASLGIGGGATVVGFAATLDRAHHFKRLDVALAAVAALEDDDVHLVVAGGGELEGEFRDQAARLGIAERVHFLGTVPHAELPGVLRACDVFLLTTEPPESFGIVLIEAMACGLPCVATEYPGVRAVIDHGETGLLVGPGDPAATAAAIRQLIAAGPEGRDRIGAAGRAKAIRLWSWPRLIDRMDEAYAEAIDVRRARTP